MPDGTDIAALKTALATAESKASEAEARATEAEARAAVAAAKMSDAEAEIAFLKLAIEKLQRELFGTRSERKQRLLDHPRLPARHPAPLRDRNPPRPPRPQERGRQAGPGAARKLGAARLGGLQSLRRRPGSTNSSPGTGLPSRGSTKPHRPAPASELHRRHHPATKLSLKHPAVFGGCLPRCRAGCRSTGPSSQPSGRNCSR